MSDIMEALKGSNWFEVIIMIISVTFVVYQCFNFFNWVIDSFKNYRRDMENEKCRRKYGLK